MTAKSRIRKRKIQNAPETRNYIFSTNKGDVTVRASSLDEARTLFQERWGYWPNKEKTDD